MDIIGIKIGVKKHLFSDIAFLQVEKPLKCESEKGI